MDDIFENIEDYNKKRKRKVLFIFDDMIPHVMPNKKAQKLFAFVPKKQFGQLITITPHSPTMLKPTNAEFSFIEIWFS